MASKDPIEASNNRDGYKVSRRIFIPAIGTLGDVKPFIILAEQLKQRGHKVWLGVHKRFVDAVQHAGIETVELGGDMDIILNTSADGIELRRNPSIMKIGLIKRTFLPMMEEWFNGIVSGIKDADLMVLSLTSVLVGLCCKEKFPNLKVIGIYAFPVIKTSDFAPPGLGGGSESLFNWINLLKWKMSEYSIRSLYQDKLNQLRAGINLPPISLDYYQMAHSMFDKPMPTATIYSQYLIPRPHDWKQHDQIVGPIFEAENPDFVPPSQIVDFLNKWENDKIIYIGLGSMMSAMLGAEEQMNLLQTIHIAVANNMCKAIISIVGFQGTENNRPSNTDNILYLTEGVPHWWLFQKVSAAIHHGGAGTVHTSLRYGLPTLVLPFGADQPFNGDRIVIKRLGPRPIFARKATVKNLTAAIHDLVSENYDLYAMNARRMGESIRSEDGLGACIKLIETALRD